MTIHFREIAVVDGNGDELTLFEIRDRASLFGLLAKSRFQLCTDEPVEKNGRGYVVPSTGEKLRLVRQR